MSTTENVDPAESPDLIHRIASLTRMLRDSMRELGLDQAIKDAANAIPDARPPALRGADDRAGRQPRAERDRGGRPDPGRHVAFGAVAGQPLAAVVRPASGNARGPRAGQDTRAFLQDVPKQTQETQSKLMEIIMAQDFQDLTGQVIMRMMDVVGAIERELLQVLLDNVPQERRDEANSLLNGPQVSPQGKADVVTSQDQVDDLLASLGF